MSTATAIERFKHYFTPPQAADVQSNPGPAPNELVAALDAPAKLAREISALEQEIEALQAKADTAIAKRNEANARLGELNWGRVAADANARQARNQILQGSPRSSEEERHHSQGMEKMRKINLLRAKHHCHATKMVNPTETEAGKRLAEVEREIAACESALSVSKAVGGTTFEDSRLRKLFRMQDELRPQLAEAQRIYSAWLEIQEVNRDMTQHFAERDRLHSEREEAAIASFIESSK
jgi:uncharacterized coiled-coil DUF342 family protein